MSTEQTPEERSAIIVEMQGEVYLTVTPPRGVGKPVDKQEVLKEIRSKNIDNINEDIVKELLDICPEQPVRITGNLTPEDLAKFRPKDRDGFADAISEKSGLHLSVHAPIGKGKKLKYKEVQEYLRRKCIVDVDYDLVKKAVKDAAMVPVRIADEPKEGLERAIGISVSEDNMEARIVLHPIVEDILPLDPQMILKMLNERGVVHGIDKKKIQELSQGKSIGEPVVVAQGQRDIVAVCAAEIPEKGDPRIVQLGRADYFQQDQLPWVYGGQVLVTRNRAEKKTLRNVMGDKAPSFDLESMRGSNTVISADSRELEAAISGHVYMSEGRVNVGRECMVIKGNVDGSKGAIDFQGTILIGGSVGSGCRIEAVGNVEVSGDIEEATITSIEGSVKARRCECSTICAAEDVLIEQEVIESIIVAHRRVCVEGQGGIVGGKVAAGVEIKAVNVGSADHSLTQLFIITSKAVQMIGEIGDLQGREIRYVEEGVQDLKKRLTGVSEKLNTQQEKAKLFKEMNNYFGLKKAIDTLRSKKEKLENTVKSSMLRGWKVHISGTMYPGVYIHIGDRKIEKKVKRHSVIVCDKEGRASVLVGAE